MAQWGALQRLDAAQQEQVNQLYEEVNFPREVRQYLAHWMESMDWRLAAEDEVTARRYFNDLVHQLDTLRESFVQENNILQRPNFTRFRSEMQRCFQEYPLNLASIICSCLTKERDILSAATQDNGVNGANPRLEEGLQMDNMIAQLRKMLQEVESVLDKQEEVELRIKSFTDQVNQLEASALPLTLQNEQRCIEADLNSLNATKQAAAQRVVSLLQLSAQTVQTLTDTELPRWRRRQQVACIGGPDEASLDQLEKWFTAVAELLLRLRWRLQDKPSSCLQLFGGEESVRQLLQNLHTALEKLLQNALVVERQPCMSSLPHRPLVVKTKTQFSVKLRFLAKLQEFRFLLKVEAVLQASSVKGFRKFVFEDGKDQSKVMDVESPGGGLVVQFGQSSDSVLSLKEKSRRSTEGPVAVTEELHLIKFVTQLHKDGLQVDIQAYSLPVVVVSSACQYPAAWASVLWYSMMVPEQDLSLFVKPPPLPWQVLSDVLSWQFKCISRRGLDDLQLNAIKHKLTDDPDDIITWGRFCKNDGVWFWINGILELIKTTNLLELWDAGYVMGFVSKEAAGALLMDKPNGTFLLRFSDSYRDGAITFSWVERIGHRATVRAVQPYTRDDLAGVKPKEQAKGVSIADEVYNYKFQQQGNPLVYLYPDIPKDHAFSRFKSKPPVIDGYVPRTRCHESSDTTPPPSPPQLDTPTPTPPVPEEMVWTPSTETLPVLDPAAILLPFHLE